MSDFQLTLRIEKIGDREAMNALNDLDKTGRRIVEGVAGATGRALGDVAVAYERGSKTIRNQLRGIADEHEKNIKALQAEEQAATRGATAQQRAMAAQQNAAEALARRQGNATLAATRGIEQIARSASVTGSALDTVLSQASQLAFGFGAAGPIVGAIAVTTVAVVDLFRRAAVESKKMADDIAKDFERIAGMSVQAQGKILQELYNGNRFSADAIKRGSVKDLERQAAEARAAIANPRNSFIGFQGTKTLTDEGRAAVESLATVNAELARRRELMASITTNSLPFVAAEEAQEEAARKGAKAKKDQNAAFEKWFVLQERQIKGLGLSGELTAMQAGALRDEAKEWTALAKAMDVSNPKYERYLALAKAASDLAMKNDSLATVATRAAAGAQLGPGMNPRDGLMGGLLEGILPTKEQAKELASELSIRIGDAVRNDPFLAAKEAFDKAVVSLAKHMRESIAQSIGGGLAAGFEAAFSGKGIGGAFKSLTATVLAGLGGFMQELGAQMLVIGLGLEAFAASLLSLNGPAAIAAGIALIAAGAGLKAIASSFGNSASVGAGGGGSSSSAGGGSFVPDFLSFGVPAATPVTSQSPGAAPQSIGPFYVIGNDPKVQRDIADIVNSAGRRNLIPGLAPA